MHWYPLHGTARPNPTPVVPEVPSMIVPPGLILPACSAASNMVMPMRSFTLPPGFKYSSFASTVARTPRTTRFRRTSGVLPITSRMLLCHMFGSPNTPNLRYHKHFFDSRFDPGKGLCRSCHWQITDVNVSDPAMQQSVNAPRTDLVGMDFRCKITLEIRDWNRQEIG